MKTIKAWLLNQVDSWDRPMAQDEEGNIYVDVMCGIGFTFWHTITEDGEPSHAVSLIFEETV